MKLHVIQETANPRPGSMTLMLQTLTKKYQTPFALHVGNSKQFEFYATSIGAGAQNCVQAGPGGTINIPEDAVQFVTDATGKVVWKRQ